MQDEKGFWKLSPSGLYTYEECKACFWLEQHLGRLPSIPLRLNDAMDEKLKNRYDQFRKRGKLPPEIAANPELKGVKLFPDLELLNQWRNNKTALRYINEKDGYIFEGKLDEVFVTKQNEYIPADYKSSGDEPGVDKQKYYRSQLHAYALMLCGKGHLPADRAYLIHYFTKDRQDPSLAMEFNCHLDKVLINLVAFTEKMREMVKFLNHDFPGANQLCQRCIWQEKRAKIKNKIDFIE